MKFSDKTYLDALSGHAQYRVAHTFDLSVDGRLAREDDHHQLEADELSL